MLHYFFMRSMDFMDAKEASEMLRQIQATSGPFMARLMSFIRYQFFTKLLAAVLFMPLLRFAFRLLLRFEGVTGLANTMAFRFFFSPQGLLYLSVSLLLLGFVLLLEQGGLLLMSEQLIAGQLPPERDLSYLRLALRSLRSVHFIFQPNGLFLLLWALLLLPILNNRLTLATLKGLKIPSFVLDTVFRSGLYTGIFLSLTLLFIVLAFFLSFANFSLLMGEKRPIRKAIRLVRQNWKTLASFYFWMALLIGLGLLIIVGLLLGLDFLLFTQLPSRWQQVFEEVEFFLFVMFTTSYSFIALPFFFYQQTALYLRLSQGKKRPLRLSPATKMDQWMKSRLAGWVMAVSLIVACISLMLSAFHAGFINPHVQIVGHRGAGHAAPENTLAALEKAMELGADAAEIDVQLSQDGKLVLLHDKSFLRTTGVDVRPLDAPLAHLQTLDAGSHFSAAYRGEKVPSLAQALAFAKGKLHLMIELKVNGDMPRMVDRLIKLIEDGSYHDGVTVGSLDLDALHLLESKAPQIKTTAILVALFGSLSEIPTDSYSLEASQIHETRLLEIAKAQKTVFAWTPNTEDELSKLLQLGVDGVITDEIALAVSLRTKALRPLQALGASKKETESSP